MFNADELSFSLISGKRSRSVIDRKLRESAFELWEPFWKDVYITAGSDYIPKADDFLRQDLITVINYHNRTIGLLFSSFYDLKCLVNQHHSYLKFYNSEFFSYLNSQESSEVMTFEYLTLLPDYRKSIIGCNLAGIIFRLAFELWKSTAARSIIVTARNDVKVNQRLLELGLHVVQEATKQRNFECDLMAYRPGDFQELKNPQDLKIFHRLWETRYQSPELSHLIEEKDMASLLRPTG